MDFKKLLDFVESVMRSSQLRLFDLNFDGPGDIAGFRALIDGTGGSDPYRVLHAAAPNKDGVFKVNEDHFETLSEAEDRYDSVKR